jgi:hypothetical protein
VYRRVVRHWALVLVAAVGCSKEPVKESPRPAAKLDAGAAVMLPVDAAPAPPPVKATTYPDLATALKATIPADARVVGFGELHQRTDRKAVTSTLNHFTNEALPVLVANLTDLIVETWFVDPKCGEQAKKVTAKVEMTVRRPQETKSDIILLADAARAAKVQPQAMRLTCEDYDKVAPKDGNVSPDVLLTITTKELTRLATETFIHRTKNGDDAKRPWIALYGGALHNDRFPATGVEDWSYAAKVDELTKNHYVEVDIIVPELAEADPAQATQPWYGLVTAADDKVHVFERGERSFVVVLPRSK